MSQRLVSDCRCLECGHNFAGPSAASGFNHYDHCPAALERGSEYVRTFRRKNGGDSPATDFVKAELDLTDRRSRRRR